MNSQSRELTTQNQTDDDADIAALGAVARDLLSGDFVGTPLKFQKGKWSKSYGKDKIVPVGATQQFVVDVRSYAYGQIRWQENKPTHKLLGRPVDGFIMPARDELGDTDQTRWPIGRDHKKRDPWQETHQITMRDLDSSDELVTWASVSWGGRKALGALLKAYASEAKKHPGLMPVVLLSSHDRPHPEFGDISEPVLTVVDWQDFGEGAAPPGQRTLAPPSAQIVTLPGVRDKRQAIGVDMDDEVPF